MSEIYGIKAIKLPALTPSLKISLWFKGLYVIESGGKGIWGSIL